MITPTVADFLTQAQQRQAFTEGQLDGYAHGRHDAPSNPDAGNIWRIGVIPNGLSSAYEDGYASGYMAGQDAREECTL
jgi:hypothetical protein